MSTYIDGIAASENIDSSGERIIIAGLDCSSLEKDGVFNYEHKSDQPNQVIGKVLKARKIFSDKDCEDDRQLYYWKKCGVPYLYVMGELFDDYKDSAREVAGMFRYDADKKGQNERNVMNFSIEGAKIDKQGMDIARSIARKVTITVLPCNKAAIAEMVPSAGKKPKDDIDNIFKTETGIEIELFQPQSGAQVIPMQKAENGPKGSILGQTPGGHDVFSHGRVGDYTGFSSADHRKAGELHMEASRKAPEARLKEHHSGKAALHMQAAGTAEKRESRGAKAPAGPKPQVKMSTSTNKFVDIPGKRASIAKGEQAPKILGGPKSHEEHEACIDMHAARVAEAKDRMNASKKDAHKSEKHLAAHNANIDAYAAAADGHRQAVEGHIQFIKKGLGMTKAETAGSAMAAPSNLTGTAALAKESLEKPMKKAGVHHQYNVGTKNDGPGTSLAGQLVRENQPGDKAAAVLEHKKVLGEMKAMPKPKLSKSQALLRAEEAYNSWEKKEEFRAYMQKKLPKLAMGEIDAIGQAMALKKTVEAERTLAKMANLKKIK